MTATHPITRPEPLQRPGRPGARPHSRAASSAPLDRGPAPRRARASGDPAAGWTRVCRLDDLEPAWGEAVLLRARQIAVFRLPAGDVYAVSHEDPAAGAPVMARGIVGSRGDRPTIASPLHKEVYDLRTGECLSDPSLAIETYPVRVVDGFVEIALGADHRASRAAA